MFQHTLRTTFQKKKALLPANEYIQVIVHLYIVQLVKSTNQINCQPHHLFHLKRLLNTSEHLLKPGHF